MRPEAVLFDLDGTLLDTLDDLADSMNRVLGRFGFSGHDREAYKIFVGDGMVNLVRRALPETVRTHEPTVLQCFEAMRDEYGRHWKDKSCPYDGIPELLDALTERGLRLTVLSNKPDDFTRMAVSALLPRWMFEAVLGERPMVPRKPDPQGALEIAERLKLPPEAFLYVGDTATDMRTANGAGMMAVGALWGFRGADELRQSGAKALIQKPTDLLNHL